MKNAELKELRAEIDEWTGDEDAVAGITFDEVRRLLLLVDALESMNQRQVEMVREAEEREERAKDKAAASVRRARRQRDEARRMHHKLADLLETMKRERDEARAVAHSYRAKHLNQLLPGTPSKPFEWAVGDERGIIEDEEDY